MVQIKTAVGDITIIDDPYTITLNNGGFELEDLQNGFSSPLYFKNDKELYSNNYKALLIRDKEKQLTGFIFKPFMGDELKFIKTD